MWLNIAYGLLLLASSPWLVYAALRRGKYREGWRAKLTGKVDVPPKQGLRVWLHAVSVGEVNLLPGIIAELKTLNPNLDFIVSTTTSTGYRLAKQRFESERVFYCPFDFTWATRACLRRVHPDLIVLAELEVWPNLIAAARRQEIPVAIINGRLSASSFAGYRRARFLLRRTFARLSLVAVQDNTYATRFASLGVHPDRLVVTGSTKFDSAPLMPNEEQQSLLCGLVGKCLPHHVFIAGSTQSGEESVALQAYESVRKTHPEMRLVIVPRHQERFDEVAQTISQSGFRCIRRSTISQPREQWAADAVVLVDTIGELTDWWGLADVAFVGGSLGSRGGQNMLEPAAYGVPVCFGPNTRNFQDIVERLLEAEAAVVIHNVDELVDFIARSLSEPEWALKLGHAAKQVVASQRGATVRSAELLTRLLSREKAKRRTT